MTPAQPVGAQNALCGFQITDCLGFQGRAQPTELSRLPHS